jgi:hypothetical protein|tara:strand:- start:45 stop:818 length:774 start_codon:yes stop_codon:yes gene_type:complete
MPRPRRKKSKIYFGSPAQEAIIEYNASEDFEHRSKVYEERIKYPFEKLAENVINTFKFSYFDVSKKDIQTEVVSVMVEKMHMFKPGKGRAFSYFTIIAKNHLILKNNGNYKRWKQNSLLSAMPETWNPENDFFESEENGEFKEFKNIMLKYWDANLATIFNKKRDLQIADAILELFRRSEHIENFNKKHLYLLIREMTDCKTHYITKVVNVMKKYQKKMLNDYHEYGEFRNPSKKDFWEKEETPAEPDNPYIDNEYL